MRIGFFGQTGPYAPSALRVLAPALSQVEVAVVVEGRRHSEGRMPHRLRKARKGPLPAGDRLSDLARALGFSVLETCDVNAPTAVRTLSDFELDWIVCVGFDRLFAPEVMATAKRGGINAHPSRLPRWRGPSPLFWAAKANERELGLTLHGIDAKEDHGPIYAQESFIAPPRATGEALYRMAGELAGRMLLPVLSRAATGTLIGTPQDDSRATRAPRPKPEDAFVDPSAWGCDHLVEFCCVAPFFRTPWLRFGDELYFVRRGLFAEPGRHLPGQFVQQGSTLIVSCRDGLAHVEIQV